MAKISSFFCLLKMRIKFCLIVLVSFLCQTFAFNQFLNSTYLLDESKIAQAFADDGWKVVSKATTSRGHRGYYAESTTANTLDSGKPKKAYYVEGDGYEMGWLHGSLSGRIGDAYKTCTVYLHHIVISLLDEQWDMEMAKTCNGWVPGVNSKPSHSFSSDMGAVSCETYESILTGLERWLVAAARTSFDVEKDKFPPELIEEMHGFVAGANDADPNSGCTINKLLYLNYGIDMLMSALYTGHLPHIISAEAARDATVPAHVAKEISAMDSRVFRSRVFCNAFGVTGQATASGSDILMGRDFQLSTGLEYQTIAADVVYVPTDGRLASVSSGAPGFIGRVTTLNAHGVTMGVDMLFAEPNTPEHPGFNSILLVRAVGDRAKSTAEAVEIITAAQRGVSWLYPVCDGAGVCVVIEAGPYLEPGVPFNPLQFVNSSALRAALPSQEFYDTHSAAAIYDRGLFVRPMNYQYPQEFVDFNRALYDLANVTYYDDEEHWGPTGILFDSFEEDKETTSCCLHSNYFQPQRETYEDVILISNFAVVPEYRTAMMSYSANLWQKFAHSASWRYDKLNQLIASNYGKIDFAVATEMMEFLSPQNAPGYWTNTLTEDPMSAVVEGTMNIAEIKLRRLTTKTGYWSDKWTHLTLTSYFRHE